MRNLAKLCAVVAICLGATGGAQASNRPKPQAPQSDQPFVKLTVPRTPLSFGVVPGPGPGKLQAKTMAHVVCNRPFKLAASFRGLSQGAGLPAIPLKQLLVTINGKEVPVGTDRVVIALGKPTAANGVDIPVVVEVVVKGSTFYPAGRYSGNLVLSIM